MGKVGAFNVYVVLIIAACNTFQIVRDACYFPNVLITFGFLL